MRICEFLILALLSSTVAFAQTPTVREEAQIYGRPGWVIENGKIRVALLRGGGHIAEVRLISTNTRLSINPMFIPAPQPGSGQSGEGYMGHLVCFPYFGPASTEERAQGLRGHGEAGSVEWQQTRPPQIDGTGITFFYGADLPKTQYKIERAVTLKAGEATVHVEEWIENLAPYDRPYNRNQHATFGAPFVTPGRNVLDMSGTRGMTDPNRTAGAKWAEGHLFQWPDAPPERRCRAVAARFPRDSWRSGLHACADRSLKAPELVHALQRRLSAAGRLCVSGRRSSVDYRLAESAESGFTGRHSARHRVRHVALRRRAAKKRRARATDWRADVQVHRRTPAGLDDIHHLPQRDPANFRGVRNVRVDQGKVIVE